MTRSAYAGTGFWVIALRTALVAAQPTPPATEPANVMLAPHDAAIRFVRPEDFDFRALLPAEQIEWAKTVDKDDAFLNREVIGEWFVPERLPATAAFFKLLVADLKAVDAAAKAPFNRQRPYQVDVRVKPCVPLPASSSYPSGSGIQAFVWAHLLAEMVPAKHDALLARAHRAAWGRVLGGVHFPTDVVAGSRLAQPFIAACRQSAVFREKFEAARLEVETANRRGASLP